MENGNKIDSAGRFAELKSGEAAVFAVLPDKRRIPARVCVKSKEQEACEQSRKKLEQQASRKGNTLQEKPAAFNAFIVAVTSLPHSVSADEVLETYRLSWQVETHFKRLKSTSLSSVMCLRKIRRLRKRG